MDPGETSRAAAVRELLEETGVHEWTRELITPGEPPPLPEVANAA